MRALIRPPSDPAPSRLSYRLTRIWLRPGVRRMVNVGVPALAGVLGLWTFAAELELRARLTGLAGDLREAILHQPQFVVSRIEVPNVSDDLAEAVRIAAFVNLPISSLELSVSSVRARIEALDAVEAARVRVLPSGILRVEAVERVPVVVWRTGERLFLLDGDGVRVAEIDGRLRRPDLPLIAGSGAELHVSEALQLIQIAEPIEDRVRGLARIGERRWDLVLDRSQTILLPEVDASASLRRVVEMHSVHSLLDRDVQVVDMRDPRRPMLRLGSHASEEFARSNTIDPGEDA